MQGVHGSLSGILFQILNEMIRVAITTIRSNAERNLSSDTRKAGISIYCMYWNYPAANSTGKPYASR